MLKNFFICLLTVSMAVSCSQKSAQSSNDGKHFGNNITAKNAITYDALMAKMETSDSLNAKVTGMVKDVCQKKGCWMSMVSDQPGKPPMRVTFKDYAFFMPKDLGGKRVVIDGFARVEVTSVEMLRHFAEDAGKSKAEIEAITQPKREVSFEASGVLVLD
jgi:hypothetical protein